MPGNTEEEVRGPIEESQPVTILLVDDERLVLELISAVLERAGYRVVAAVNGEEALQAFQAAPESIHLLVSDVDMPEMTGMQLAEFVIRARPTCRVLLISGKALPAGVESGPWEFLAKPFVPSQLLHVIEGLLGRRSAARCRIALAEDHAEARQALCELLGRDNDVVASCGDGRTLLEMVEGLRPDVIILDIGMPDMNGFAVARILRQSMPSVPLMFVTQHAERAYVEEALRCGVSGYVLKRRVADELDVALQRVRAGNRYVSPAVAGKLF